VFLHGLNGDPEKTWTNGGFYWPLQIAKDILGSRVMVYGYNADFERSLSDNKASINSIAQSLIGRLVVKRDGNLVSYLKT
jgi:hypothetical protein